MTERPCHNPIVIRARRVVTMNGPPIENGAVAVAGNRIVDIGAVNEIIGRYSGQKIDLEEQVLLPGLINAHCHLDYTCLRGKIPAQERFTDWIRAINQQKTNLSADHYLDSIASGFAEAKCFGTTTIVNFEAFPELIAKICPPMRIWWLAELIDVRETSRARAIVDGAVALLKIADNCGLAPHAPFTASPELYRYSEDSASFLATHLAESTDEMCMFRDAGGPLYKFLRDIGRDMSDCGGRTPLAVFLAATHLIHSSADPVPLAGAGRSPPKKTRWMLIHMNELAPTDFLLLERSAIKFDVVHCPRSHAFFHHSPFQYERLRSFGFNICVGTDSLASNNDLSLFRELRAFRTNWPHVAPSDLLSMVTINPAAALGRSHVLGRLSNNYLADMIALPCQEAEKNWAEEVLAFDGKINWCMVNGDLPRGSHI